MYFVDSKHKFCCLSSTQKKKSEGKKSACLTGQEMSLFVAGTCLGNNWFTVLIESYKILLRLYNVID